MNNPEMVGLIPAGGGASRISPLPCSKEIFPVGFREIRQNGKIRPKVAAHYLLEKMHFAGAKTAYIVLKKGKWDIPAYFGSGSTINMSLGYLVTDLPYGVPFTLDNAYPFIKDKLVLFGFPDIIFEPKNAFNQLTDHLISKNVDIVLGLFPATNPSKMDMVDLDSDGNICGIQIKPAQTILKYTWIMAVWTFHFTFFMHHYVANQLQNITDKKKELNTNVYGEIYLGDVIHAAIESNIKIGHVLFMGGNYIDIGTIEDMTDAIHRHTPQLKDIQYSISLLSG